MKIWGIAIVLLAAIFAGGCYHATIETGLTPSSEVIKESFASCWVYGLVPPKTIEAQMKCKNGVARVETQHSFLTQLVGVLTLGIYTPIEITVTCAAGTTSMIEGGNPGLFLQEGANTEEVQRVFSQAADIAVASGQPVYVKY